MQIRFLLIPLLLVPAISCSSRHGIKIVLVSKYGLFEDRVQKSLESALKWFENAVFVNDFVANTKFNQIRSMIEGYDQSTSTVTIQTPNKLFSLDINSPEFEELFKAADHVVFIEDMKCSEDIPYAHTGSLKKASEKIPKVSLLHWCYHEQAEFSYFDLFRHEILHGLGYGTETSIKSLKMEEKYNWRNEDSSVSKATRYSIKFNEKVLGEVRKYFECPDVKSVEVDDIGIHLNEYIFYNELMTPKINTGVNYLSWISVAILEQVYAEKEQVFFVNRTFVAPEADAYHYAKGFGCSWLFKSCHEFLAELKANGKERPAPFCPEYEPNATKVKCFKNGKAYSVFDCRSEEDPEMADNGIFYSKNAMYQNWETRFCPIFQHYDQLSMYPITECNAMKSGE